MRPRRSPNARTSSTGSSSCSTGSRCGSRMRRLELGPTSTPTPTLTATPTPSPTPKPTATSTTALTATATPTRSEEHTSELQSRGHLVCRLLLEKKKKQLLPSLYHKHYTS